jgi:sugar (pentulose or hexulose) kinase
MGYLLGIDAGTTMVKVGLFDEAKGAVAHAEVDCTVSFKNEKRAEIDMEIYWEACIQCLKRVSLTDKTRLADVKAIAISSQGVTFVPVDRQGKELRKGIFLYDTRAVSEAEEIMNTFGEEKIYEVTGQPVITAQFEAPKLMWIRKHEPECFRKIYKILLVHDYLVYKFTGKYICVQPLISSSLLFNVKQKKWWEEMLDFVELSDKRLPDVYKPGEAVGTIAGAAALETGISSKAVVVAGAIDQVCGMLGIGNTHPGLISESTGSVLAVHTVSNDVFSRRDAGVHNFCNAVDNTYALISICPSAGTTLNWFKETFCEKEMEDARKKGRSVFELILHEAEEIDAGSDGLIMLPHLAGRGSPKPNMLVKGLFFGLRLDHRKAHFVRSLIESVAYMLKSNVEVFKSNGLAVKEIRSFGGGSKSRLWNQIKADVCVLPVVTSGFHEPGCLGAAILSGVGGGIYEDIENGCDRLVSLKEPLYPDKENSRRYEFFYHRYSRLNETVEPLFELNNDDRAVNL